MNEKYRHEGQTPDYRHDRHAGNVGDVWKHLVLHALLGQLTAESDPITVIETHGGGGSYDLGPTGEWTEGVAKVVALEIASGLIGRYRSGQPLLDRGERQYSGSPLIIASYLRDGDEAFVFEIQPDVATQLRDSVSGSSLIVRDGDGIAALAELEVKNSRGLILIDPPWTAKRDWIDIPDALVAALRRYPAFTAALWYPIKSYTRVHAMVDRVRSNGVRCGVIELLTTPLGERRNRLNGSGMLVVNCSANTFAEVSAIAPLLGEACASADFWQFRLEKV